MHVALYGRCFRFNVEEKMRALLDLLFRRGETISCCSVLLPYMEEHGFRKYIGGSVFSSFEDIPESTDLLLSLGGDGTFLNALTIVRDRRIPIAGINFGRLGFLTSVQIESPEGCQRLESILDGDFGIRERTVLEFGSEALPRDFFRCALNEISIAKRDPYMIGIEVKVDGHKIPTYWADGLIVSTPTGSTAYSMSVGGPVVVPDSQVFVIAPMASHNFNVRPLIVPDSSVIEISILSDGHPVFLSADNRTLTLDHPGAIIIKKAPFPVRCVSLGHLSFFGALNEKLLWGADMRNEGFK